MTPVFCKIVDPANLGDSLCCPRDYFPEFKNCPLVDIREPLPGPVIFGGGGLLHEGVDVFMEQADPKSIVWGAGSNYHDPNHTPFPDWLDRFTFVGLRDFGNPWNYVPCASCLHPAFDENFGEPSQEVVVYEHHQHGMDLGLPSRKNDGRPEDFPEVLRFLASGRVVLTNTYHGAYWASLLGRPVVIINPFSSRFHRLKPAVAFATEDNWRDAVSAALARTGYLQECRTINQRMFQKVQEILKRP